MNPPEFIAQELEKKKVKGFSLCGLPPHISRVSEGVSLFESVPNVKERLVDVPEYFNDLDVDELVRKLPLSSFKNFSKEEIARLWQGSVIMWDNSFEKEANEDPFFCLLEKIRLALWHSSFKSGRENWNIVAETYERIRNFSVPFPETEVSFDYSRGANELGYSQYEDIFLDSEMAFLIHQKGEHVLTLGFSVDIEPGVYLAQVQSPIKTGNRFLFSLGENPVNGATDLFLQNFKGFSVYVIDPDSLIEHLKRTSANDPNHFIPVDRIKKTYGGIANRYDREEKLLGKNKYHKIKNLSEERK